jgi:hypothetical protein
MKAAMRLWCVAVVLGVVTSGALAFACDKHGEAAGADEVKEAPVAQEKSAEADKAAKGQENAAQGKKLAKKSKKECSSKKPCATEK